MVSRSGSRNFLSLQPIRWQLISPGCVANPPAPIPGTPAGGPWGPSWGPFGPSRGPQRAPEGFWGPKRPPERIRNHFEEAKRRRSKKKDTGAGKRDERETQESPKSEGARASQHFWVDLGDKGVPKRPPRAPKRSPREPQDALKIIFGSKRTFFFQNRAPA